MEKDNFFGIQILKKVANCVALVLSASLILAAVIIMKEFFIELYRYDVKIAIQDGLFAVILLEMFYVVRSFINHGSMNAGLIINVGIIAAVKELIFVLDSITLQTAGAFGIVFISLGVGYLIENRHFQAKKSYKEDHEN